MTGGRSQRPTRTPHAGGFAWPSQRLWCLLTCGVGLRGSIWEGLAEAGFAMNPLGNASSKKACYRRRATPWFGP